MATMTEKTTGADFILVSEFSEIQGPIPLFTIPEDGAQGFDKEA